MKKIFFIFLAIFAIFSFTSCSTKESKIKKIEDLTYTIVTPEDIPNELMLLLEEKKVEPFTFSFFAVDSLYLCVGYGEQKTSGYSICINECYIGSHALFLDTNLIGPSYENAKNPTPSYPYIVLKTKPLDLQIVFD